MSESMTAWQCATCGKIDGPQACRGICNYERVQLVHASDHAETCAQRAAVEARLASAVALLNGLVRTTPREGQWEASYRIAQARAALLIKSWAQR